MLLSLEVGRFSAAGKKIGIVHNVYSSGIGEATYFEGKEHGLRFVWTVINSYALWAHMFEHGKDKAEIKWKEKWLENYSTGNKV